MKVFGIGLSKTGTTSLGMALHILGFKVCRGLGVDWKIAPEWVEPIAKQAISKYDAFVDLPWPFLYDWIHLAYPDAKFILTLRDSKDAYESLWKHVGERNHPLRQWAYGQLQNPIMWHEFHQQIFDWHKERVMELFDGTNRLCVMNICDGDGWSKLCPFLGMEDPERPFPHENKEAWRKLEDLVT